MGVGSIVWKVLPSTPNGRTTLLSVVLESFVVILLQLTVALILNDRFKKVLATDNEEMKNKYTAIPVYLMIFNLSQLFQIVLCWDALLNQNTIQIFGLVVFNFCVFSYSIFQCLQIINIGELANTVMVPLFSIPIVTGIFAILFCYMAMKLFSEFGWSIYKKIGADIKMRNLFRSYQIFLTLLKFDLFFFVAFSAQFITLVLDKSDPEWILTMVALPITVIMIVFAIYGLTKEDKLMMKIFIGGLIIGVAYFVFKIVRMWDPKVAHKYVFTRSYLAFFSSLTLTCVILTIVYCVICYRNFDKGLKAHLLAIMQSSDKRPS